jgi:hypothetical protein
MSQKVCQLAGMHPELQFLMVNSNEQKEMCRRLNVHVLPMFRFYRGAEGRICSFSCTISTVSSVNLSPFVNRLPLSSFKLYFVAISDL